MEELTAGGHRRGDEPVAAMFRRAAALALASAVAAAGAPARPVQAPAKAEIIVTLLGTGNPRPAPDRFGPSSLVEAGPERLLVDAGRGNTVRLFEIGGGALLSGITSVFLTHLHSDHVVGVPDLWLTGWIFGRTRPLEVVGPAGTVELAAGLERAYAFDVRMRRDIDERLPAGGAQLDARDVQPGVVLDRNGVRVIAFAVDHAPVAPAYGYRIEYAGRSVVFSGDTRYSEAVAAAARGADVLVHEVLSPEVERARTQVTDPAAVERIIAHHTTPEEAGRIFAAASPRLAVYSHIVPSPTTAADLIGPTRRAWKGPLEVGEDLMRISIGDRVTVDRRAPSLLR
jgi:ribonuclease Z